MSWSQGCVKELRSRKGVRESRPGPVLFGASEHRRDGVGQSEEAHAGLDESPFGLSHLEEEMSLVFEARVAVKWESEA